MASAFISSPSEIVLIDSRTRSGTITLPVTNSIPYRVVSFKDQYGSFSNSTMTLSTQVGESFDDGTTTKTFSNAFTSMQLYATSSKWMVLNATQSIQQSISSLIVNQLIFGTGAGWVQFGPLQASIVSSIQMNTNDAYINNLYVGNQSTMNDISFYGLFGNYNNTVLAEISTGAGTQEFLTFKGSSTSDRIRYQTTGSFVVETGVSARLWDGTTRTTLSNATPAFVINTSSNVGIQTASPGATLDVAGTARAVTLSSQQLFFSSVNGGLPLSITSVTSTVQGLGSAGYISTPFQNAGFLSSPNLLSTTGGLQREFQTAGFLSSANLLSTTGGLQREFNTAGFLSSANLLSTTGGLQREFQTAGFLSSPNLLSTTGGLQREFQTAGFLSSPNLLSTTGGLQREFNTAGFVSSANLLDLVSTSYLTTQLASSVAGVQLNFSSLSTTYGIQLTTRSLNTLRASTGFTSVSTLNLIDPYLATQAYLTVSSGILLLNGAAISGGGGSGGVSQIVAGSNITINPVGGTGAVTITGTSPNALDLTSSLRGLGTIGYVSSLSLFSSINALDVKFATAGFVSVPNLLGFVSSASLRSTVVGLGQIYLSTAPSTLLANAMFTSSLLASTITTSSLQVNSLTIGTGTGWLNLGPLQTVAISSIQLNTNDGYINNVYVGTQSTMNDIMFYGLFGNYNNSVIAEISTGAGTQELLVFKGSSTSDRVRVQTTGTFAIETGVSARLWDGTTRTTLSNVTPAFVINTSSNVGIQTASPGATLDVAGISRAITLSSQQLFFSSVNGGLPLSAASLTSTTAGITAGYQTAGFLSSLNLISTTGQLQSNISNWSQYPATNDISIETGLGIRPVDPNQALQLKADSVLFVGTNGGYGALSMGESITFQTSSSLESYSIGFSPIASGTISTFVMTRSDGIIPEAAPVYISSLYLGNFGGTTAGQLTTDATATDLFWKGSKLNSQTGGGGGGGAIDYVSAFTVSTSYLQVSSISSYVIECYGVIGSAFFNLGPDNLNLTSITDAVINANSTIINTNTFHLTSSNDARFVVTSNAIFESQVATFSNIYCENVVSTYTLAVYGPNTLIVDGTSIFRSNVAVDGYVTNREKIVVSTLGIDDMFIQVADIGTKFLLEGSNSPQNIVLPPLLDAGVNWNVLLNNQFTNFAAMTILDNNSNVVGPTLNPGMSVTATTDGIRWYFY